MIVTLTALATITGLISFAADFSKCVSVEAVTELEPRLPANSPLLEKMSGDIPSVTFSVKNLKNYTLRDVTASCMNTSTTYDNIGTERATQRDGQEADPAKVTSGDSQEFPSLLPGEPIQFQCTTQVLVDNGHPELPDILPDSAEIKIAVDYKLFWIFRGRDRFTFKMRKSPNGQRKFMQVPLVAPTGDA